jgi:hypothetical protein
MQNPLGEQQLHIGGGTGTGTGSSAGGSLWLTESEGVSPKGNENEGEKPARKRSSIFGLRKERSGKWRIV